MLNMFRMLIRPSSGAFDLCVELFHGLYWSGSMWVGVTMWSGCGGVVSVCRLKHYCALLVLQPAYGYHTTTAIPQRNTNTHRTRSISTHEITQHISRKLLRMDVLKSETCWALNKEIIKQVTSSWSLFYSSHYILQGWMETASEGLSSRRRWRWRRRRRF